MRGVRKTDSLFDRAAVVEYLGEGYPLYFENVFALESMLNRTDILEAKVQEGHAYLKRLDKTRLSMDYFGNTLRRIADDVIDNRMM